MAQSRFIFPGFKRTRIEDTSTHEVEIGTIEDGGHIYNLMMIRNAMHKGMNFLVSKIADSRGTEIWDFKNECFCGVGVLAQAEEEIVIAFVGKGREGAVERIIPLRSFYASEQPDLYRLISLKRGAARFLNRDHRLSEAENLLVEIDSREQQAERSKLAQAARDEEAAARHERICRMLARGKITCYTAQGKIRYGIPVLESEWASITPGLYVVVVDSVDDKTGRIGKPIQAFRVVKQRGKNPEKAYAANVTAEPPTSTTNSQIKKVAPIGEAVIRNGEGHAHLVQVFASMEAIRTARTQGLNSGTYVAANERDPNGKIEVYAAHSDRMDTVGKFIPVVMKV
jgi:hypothetical protein